MINLNYNRCLICGCAYPISTISKKKEKHHVIFENKIRHLNKNKNIRYISSWKGSLKIPFCRQCHDLYHKLYNLPSYEIEELIYKLPPPIIEITINHINRDNIKFIIQDAIAASFLIPLIDSRWCNTDYYDVCKYFTVLPGDLYRELIKRIIPILPELDDIPLYREKIPAFILDDNIYISKVTNGQKKLLPRKQRLDRYCINFIKHSKRRGEASIIKYVNQKMKQNNGGFTNNSIRQRLHYLCDIGKLSSHKEDGKIYYRSADQGG